VKLEESGGIGAVVHMDFCFLLLKFTQLKFWLSAYGLVVVQLM
jgi:hypothetical protein